MVTYCLPKHWHNFMILTRIGPRYGMSKANSIILLTVDSMYTALNSYDLIMSRLRIGYVHPDLVMTTYDQVMTCLCPHPVFLGSCGQGISLNFSYIRSRPLRPPWLTMIYPDLHNDGLGHHPDLTRTSSHVCRPHADHIRILIMAKKQQWNAGII